MRDSRSRYRDPIPFDHRPATAQATVSFLQPFLSLARSAICLDVNCPSTTVQSDNIPLGDSGDVVGHDDDHRNPRY